MNLDRIHTALLLSMLTLAFCPARATRAESPKPVSIPERMKQFIEKHDVAGVVTLVADKDKVLALDAVGMADVAGNVPMKSDAIFWIASMTKPVTGTAIMMLAEEGKLSVDDPVGKFIPELAHLKTADGVEHVVTLEHLLTHSSGMPDVTADQSRAAHTLADLVPYYTLKPLHFVPGTKWQYCQSAINTLGRIVEVVSGQSYPEFLQKRLFDPLGMKDTTFYPTKEQQLRLAKSYKVVDGKLQETPNFFLQGRPPESRQRIPAANGGLFSTASDYGRFLQMILNQGELDGHRYLKPETVRQMTTVQSGDLKTGFTPGNGWGLGWCVVREPQGVTAALSPGAHGHGGAYGTQAWIDPQKGLVLVLMVQRANFPNSDGSEIRAAFQEAAVAAAKR
jgi:CubicO group peptidase (beta-lactamase class C family)